MSSVPDSDLKVTWSQKLTDFTIVLKSGKHLKVHKHVLAENSEAFEAMLTQEFEEAKTNQMSMAHFEDTTVYSFIEYLYADRIKDPEILRQIRAGIGPDDYIYKRCFQAQKLTVNLLKMAHMYRVEDLKADCIEYLMKNISDLNVMDVWLGAEALEYGDLASTAREHLANRPPGRGLKDVPGFIEAFQSYGKPLQGLMEVLSNTSSFMKEDNCKLREDISKLMQENFQLKVRVMHLEESRIIKVTVVRKPGVNHPEWTEDFYVKSTDLISTLLEKVKDKRGQGPYAGHWPLTSETSRDTERNIKRNKTFEENDIVDNTTLLIWSHPQSCKCDL